MKKIIFFDGDGTLWYPKKTKRLEKPHWVYNKYKNYKPHLVITPTTLSTLKTLKKQGIYLVILSTHPHLAKEAKIVLTEKVMHFKLDRFFNEVIATREDPSSKKQYILRTLKKLHLPKPAALMVGDSYKWDYLPARQAGIDPVLLDSVYRKKDSKAKKVQQVIQTVKEVLRYV